MSYEQAREVISQLPDVETFEEDILAVLLKHSEYLPAPSILREWLSVIRALYDELPRQIPPEPPKETIEHARWRDKVNAIAVPPDINGMHARSPTIASSVLPTPSAVPEAR